MPGLFTVNVTTNPTLLYGSKGGVAIPIQVINLSTSATVWIGNTSTLTTSASSIPLLPGASSTFDGSVSIWGITSTGSGSVGIVPGGISYSPGTSTQQLFSVSGVSLSASGTLTPTPVSPILNVSNFASYDMVVNAFATSQGTLSASLTIGITLTWFDDPSGTVPVYQETWETWLANNVNGIMPAYGSGSHHGAYFQVSAFQPSGGSTPVTISSITCYGSPRPLNGSSWRQTPPSQMTSGVTMLLTAPYVESGQSNVLANFEIQMASTSLNWVPLPLASGPIFYSYSSNLALASNTVLASANQLVNGGIVGGGLTQGTIINFPNTASTQFTGQLINGRTPLYLVVKSAATTPLIEFFASASQGSV